MRVLVLRFSSLGDVTLCSPVLKNVLQNNPGLQITFVSRPAFKPLFTGMNRLNFFAIEPKGRHKGIPGLWKLARELKKQGPFERVIDLHGVLRSIVLSAFMFLPVSRIDKGRSEKKRLTQYPHKVKTHLKHTIERYQKVFEHAAIATTEVETAKSVGAEKIPAVEKFLSPYLKQKKKLIGVAPLSAHTMKQYPEQKMSEVLDILGKNKKIQLFLLGSGGEKNKLQNYIAAGDKTDIINLAGVFTFEEELAFIQKLDLVITMDSANLHIAAALGTKTLSIWGPTHVFAGFGPPNTPNHLIIEDTRLDCRPCSIYGNKPCFRKDFACMHNIEPKEITGAALALISK